MITKSVFLASLDTGTFLLGYVGENVHIRFSINCASIFDGYPDAAVTMKIKAPDGTVYPKVVTKDGVNVLWTVTASDTAVSGVGQVQLTFTDGEEVIKTVVASTTIMPSITGEEGPAPDPIAEWVEDANAVLALVQEAISGIPAEVQERVASDVEAWLEENITNPDSPPLDRSLSLQTAAAPADLAGDIRRELRAVEVKETNSTSAAVMTVTDGADDIPVVELVAGIDPVQSGSGDPSPENIRPISGHTGMIVTRAGKNLFNKSASGNVTNKYLNHTTGGLGNSSTGYDTSGYIKVEENKTYCASGFSVSSSTEYCFYDGNKNFISGISSATRYFTTPAGTVYMRFDYKHIDLDVMQLESGSTATAYESYQGNTYSVTFPTPPGTVYGGTLTINQDGTGTLVVDTGILVYDGVNSKLLLYKQGNVSYVFRANRPENSIEKGEYCNKLATGDESTDRVSNGKVSWYAGLRGSYAYVDTDLETITTQEQFDTWCASENLQIVYRLSDPVEYTLTASQIKTLLGTNNIWADTGNILSLTYPSDTKLYIDKKIAGLQALILENV